MELMGMGMEITKLHLITAVVGFACLFDLATKKVPNWLNAVLFSTALLLSLSVYATPFPNILLSLLVATLIGFSLFAFRAVGAGDAKLLMAISPFLSSSQITEVAAQSLLWALLISFLFLLLSAVEKRQLFLAWPKIPHTFAILLGVLSSHQLGGLF